MRSHRVRRLATAIVALALFAGLAGCEQRVDVPPQSSAVKIPLAGKIAPPKSGAYTGVFVPPAPFEIRYVDHYTYVVGKKPSIVMWFQPWEEKGASRFDRAAVVSVLQRGYIPMITWEPWDPTSDPNDLKEPAKQSDYRLKRILDGEFDDYIRGWARSVKQVGGPVMIRPMHEMNGNWYPWCGTANGNQPEEFKQAWRHVVDIFNEEGATNVTWVWSINRESVPDNEANAFAVYYPGDDYVDWTSISGFNWGTSGQGTKWTSFTDIYDAPLAYLGTKDKPIVLSEFGCAPDGGDKAAWIADAYRVIAKHPEIDAVIYYDKLEQGVKGKQDWRFESSPKSAAAFKNAVGSSYFSGDTAPELRSWGSGLDRRQWTYLRTLQPVY